MPRSLAPPRPPAKCNPCASAIAVRIPLYEPGPIPTARQSTCSRSTWACRRAASIMSSALAARASVSTISLRAFPIADCQLPIAPGGWTLACTTATLRCGAENSMAKIVIDNAALVLTQRLNLDPPQTLETLDYVRPFVRPFNHGHARWTPVLLQAGGADLLKGIEPV